MQEKKRRTSLNTSPNEEIEDSGIQLKAIWTEGDWTLSSTTALRQWENQQTDADTDYVPADLFRLFDHSDIDTLSQEFTLLWQPDDQLQLLTGLYLATEDYSGGRNLEGAGDADNFLISLLNPTFTPAPCLPPIETSGCVVPTGIGALLPNGSITQEKYQQDSDSYALYSHLSWDINTELQLVGGLRYSVEDKSGSVDIRYWYDSPISPLLTAIGGFPNDGTPRNGLDIIGVEYSPPFDKSIKDEEVTGSLALNYRLSDDIMAYTSYSRGFKAGGINLFREAVLTDTTHYDPEYADSYEIGLKSQYWQGRASSNIALFYTEFSDLQVNFFDGLNFRTENTGKARTQGVELENTLLFTEQWTMDFAVTYLEATFESLDNPQLDYLLDRDTPRAPDWASVLGINFNQQLSANLKIKARASLSYTGDHYVGADVVGEEKQDEYLISDLSISLQDQADSWAVTLWCKNCDNQDYRTIYFNSAFQEGSNNAYLNAPRQYGATFSMKF
ncbi:TonB-dependent receptor domain-containing protein [Oceanicoccus sagamiensis]|uniref:TonB-dependent receptor domain-containing protein n=1 Tax=Oceanicoccus sagamiensis TaxID=716816 RepID=UPI000A270A59